MRKTKILSIFIAVLVLLVGCNPFGGLKMSQTLDPITGLPEIPDCNQAVLISESIPTGTEFTAGTEFEKTWLIRNDSLCEWSDQFSLVYFDGVGMNGITHISFAENLPAGTVIPPGGTATLTLNLRAPYAPGNQVGTWKLRDPSGLLFMPKNTSQDGLKVSIKIVGSIYNFVTHLCEATWTIDGQPSVCGSKTLDSVGQIMVDDFPQTEEIIAKNEPAIAIQMPERADSFIRGSYPAIEIHPGDHLHAITACGQDLPGCDLTFEIGYQVGTEQVVLGSWREISDGRMQIVDIDLSALSGRMVRFFLTTRANNVSQDNHGYWFLPVLLPY